MEVNELIGLLKESKGDDGRKRSTWWFSFKPTWKNAVYNSAIWRGKRYRMKENMRYDNGSCYLDYVGRFNNGDSNDTGNYIHVYHVGDYFVGYIEYCRPVSRANAAQSPRRANT